MAVSLGSLGIKGDIQANVRQIYPHPKYDPKKYKNDIALLELSEDLIFSQNLSRIPIDSSRITPNQLVIAAGWGQTESKHLSPQLLQVTLRTAPNQICRRDRPGFRSHNGPQICTGGTPGKDTCPGDSGGPLLTKERESSMKLLGVTSFGTFTSATGFRCGDDTLGYFTHVAYHMMFIKQVTKLNDSQLLSASPYVNFHSNLGLHASMKIPTSCYLILLVLVSAYLFHI
ncbi:trypsin-like serine protease [Basidiobolus meristosporus CBS 931.73]|uniref:Trypsin-like serine protease n=1 Tax=Basidiobolus meristosporus CBS 931.73 TaxID=1314790 RepID=A0A1Y1YA48_9FUNG|nr:trypsin-like serine protease [Basidiobolus meristosporus CBS 931.73]|eukprot:ORX94890.1 trypsin-like serine protease [Basidiobolus meristosporus CBS 931.73]